MDIISFVKKAFNWLFGKKEIKKVEEKVTHCHKTITSIKKEPEFVKEQVEEKVTAKEIKSAVNKPRTKREPKFKASKAAIKLAKENGIDLTKVTGTGKEGNITVTDIKKLID